MSSFGRVAITCVAVLLVGALSYASAIDLGRGGTVGPIVHSGVLDWAFFALLALTVAVVHRWWALSVAFVPLAVSVFLHSATDYVYPYHEDPYPVLTVFGSAILLCVCLLGYLLRALFDRTRTALGAQP